MLCTSITIFSNQKNTNETQNEERLGEQYPKPKDDDTIEIPEIQEKQWFEYVEYDKNNPIITYIEKNKIVLYTPTDFSLATIMQVSPLTMSLEIGKDNLNSTKDYSTASSVEVTYERSSGFAWGFNENIELELIKEFKITFGSNQDWHYDETVTISRTFDAILVNGDLVPWRVVQYQVQAPVYIEVYENNILTEEVYLICNLMTGLCREWADGYIEHWSTGKRVSINNFYGEYFTIDNLVNTLRKPW
jgi:hypothetical protein